MRKLIDTICGVLYPGSENAGLGWKMFVLAMLAAIFAVAVARYSGCSESSQSIPKKWPGFKRYHYPNAELLLTLIVMVTVMVLTPWVSTKLCIRQHL